MKKQRVVRGIPVEEGSGNVYTDLGYPDSESMLVKAQLAAKIAEIIKRRALTQARQRRSVNLVSGCTQQRHDASPTPSAMTASVHKQIGCRHPILLRLTLTYHLAQR